MAALLGSLSFLSLIVAILARSVPFSDSGAINRGGSCILDVNNDLPKKNEPLLLSQSPSGFSLLLPEGHGRQGIINLQEGEAIYVACTGQRNAIEWTNHVTDKAVCRSGSLLSVNGRDLKSVDLDCRSRAEAKTKVTNRPCANGKGIIVELGFEAMGWHKMIDVCHNLAQMSTYYSAHTINGARLAGKVYRTTGRPLFAKGDPPLYRGTNPDAAYKLKNQEVVLSQLLGPQVARSLLDQRSNHFLSRGHLAPDADFLLSPHQFLTYFFVNVAPQWQSINGGNWLKIETDTRNLAKRLRADLEVVTGTYGVLRLPGQKGVKEISLHQSNIPVPELYWKLVRNPQDNSCIAFVATNNPFLKERPHHICQDVCAQNRWPSYQNDFSRGYVYCCQYADIKRAIPEIPNLSCRSTIRG